MTIIAGVTRSVTVRLHDSYALPFRWFLSYLGVQDHFMREVGGITLEYFGPGLAL